MPKIGPNALNRERIRIRKILSFVIASKLTRFWREAGLTPLQAKRFDDMADEMLGVIHNVTEEKER